MSWSRGSSMAKSTVDSVDAASDRTAGSCAETGADLPALATGLAHCIVRPPVVYGPGDAATRLLFRQALAPLVAVPARRAPLSVIHSDDVVDALLAAIQRRPAGAILP